jgi:predicted transcriptional regulator
MSIGEEDFPYLQASAPTRHMPYHMTMGRREVLVQLDDDLVGRLDALAKRAGTSRSELLRRGALAVLQAAELAEADQQLIEAYRRQPQDPVIVTAAARLAAENAPAW